MTKSTFTSATDKTASRFFAAADLVANLQLQKVALVVTESIAICSEWQLQKAAFGVTESIAICSEWQLQRKLLASLKALQSALNGSCKSSFWRH